MLHENFYEDSQSLFVNACAPRSHFTPFDNAADALSRALPSSQVVDLNGEWSLQVFDDISNIGDEVLTADYSLTSLKNIIVPSFLTDEQFAPSHNTAYPFALDLPHVFGINPAAVYFKEFEVENDFVAHKKYLCLEGVGCAYIYINGEFVGFTKHRRVFAEFDITEFCSLGNNRVTIVVLKWSDADYHQCQDIINLHGIFGDIKVLYRPRGHLSDIKVESILSDDLSNASIEININALIAEEAEVSLYSPEGNFLASSGVDTTGFSKFNLQSPLIYSAETPDLYTVSVEYSGEFITVKVGIRAIEIDNGVLKINRRVVKLKGVSWQLIDAKNGYSLAEDDIQTVLLKLKRCNLNSIKFSEMPPVKLLQLCNELGFYVICGNGLDMTFMRESVDPSSLHVLEDVFSEISFRTYENFKNCSGIIVWDMGKNLGCGEVLRKIYDELYAKDGSRPVHYFDKFDNTIGDFKAEFSEDTNEITFDGEDVRPVLISNCTDNLAKNYEKMYNETKGCGVFFDNLHTQAINFNFKTLAKQELSNGKALRKNLLLSYSYDPLPMYHELKFLAAPLTVEPISLHEGTFNVISRYDFTYLSRLQGSFELVCGSNVLQCGQLGVLSTPPHHSQEVRLNLNIPANEDTYLRLTFTLQADDIYASSGYVVSEHQFKISKTEEKIKAFPAFTYSPQISENAHKLNILGDGFRYTFNKKTGCFETLNLGEENILQNPVVIDLATSLERVAQKLAKNSSKVENIFTRIFDLNYEVGESLAVLSLKISLNAAGIAPIAEVDATYKILACGTVVATYNAIFADDAPSIDGFGLTLNLPPSFDKVTYFGLGPNDCTKACHAAMYKAVFEQKLKDSYGQKSHEIYRHDCDWVAVAGDDRAMLVSGNFDLFVKKDLHGCTLYAGLSKKPKKNIDFEIKFRPVAKFTTNLEEIVNSFE